MKSSILIVDDDPDIARFVEVNLKKYAGYENIATASDGLEALELARVIRPDLVITNISMPGMFGFELIQRLRQDPLNTNATIVILSARALKTDVEQGLASGADDYITKPFDPVELLIRIAGARRRCAEGQEHPLSIADLEARVAADMLSGDPEAQLGADILSAGHVLETKRTDTSPYRIRFAEFGWDLFREEVGHRAVEHSEREGGSPEWRTKAWKNGTILAGYMRELTHEGPVARVDSMALRDGPDGSRAEVSLEFWLGPVRLETRRASGRTLKEVIETCLRDFVRETGDEVFFNWDGAPVEDEVRAFLRERANCCLNTD